MDTKVVTDEEVEVVVKDLLEVYGYDFADYSRASLKRRINRLFTLDRFPSFAEFRFRIKSDPDYLRRFVKEVTVNVTEMFRDPPFYRSLRQEVLPVLATYPLIRIWHAGCSTGEEVYSMAILLKEANLLHKSLLYATDINPDVLEQASLGIFPISQLKLYSQNYVDCGGLEEFSSYYTAQYDQVKFDESLRSKMIYATHNLVSDRSFNEFQLILCRNTLIYFDILLQEKVFGLFDDSLETLGYMALGSRENIRFSSIARKYRQLPGNEKIWRKIA